MIMQIESGLFILAQTKFMPDVLKEMYVCEKLREKKMS